jgi:hypothetical protein
MVDVCACVNFYNLYHSMKETSQSHRERAKTKVIHKNLLTKTATHEHFTIYLLVECLSI